MKVPFNDLYAQYKSIREELDAAMEKVVASSSFIRGPFVQIFESDFGTALGGRHCVSCGNGTDALFVALRSFTLQAGDEVITPANSWISSAETITQAGGKVVFCDIDPNRYTLDANCLEKAITPKTRGIIAVHLYGQCADMSRILSLAKKYGLWVIEDCAQAHFASQDQKVAGTMGDVGTFSFFPGKNLGAMGDAGCLVTADSERAAFFRKFACHGAMVKGAHEMEGINSRMDGLQAAILSVKLKHIKVWTERRRYLAEIYHEQLGDMEEITRPQLAENGSCPAFHLYVIRTRQRDALKQYLAKADIETGIHYPTALPFLPAYNYLGYSPEDFPVAFSHQSQLLSLPIFPEMSDEMVGYVARNIRKFFRKKSGFEK